MQAMSTLYVYPSGCNQGSEPHYRVENPHDKSRRPRRNNHHYHQENHHRYPRNPASRHHRNKPRHPRHHPDSLDPYNHYQSPPQNNTHSHSHSQDISPSSHSPRYDRHNFHNHHLHHFPNNHDNYNFTPNITASPSPSIASSDSTAHQLYFPLNDLESIIPSTPRFNETPQPPTTPASSTALDNDEDPVSTPDPAAATLAKLGSITAPPLSALKASDGTIMLSVEDMERMSKLPISDIQQILNDQRLKNEELLAKLHNDQKNFVKVLKHYEKKNRRLEKQIFQFEANDPKTVEGVMLMTQLLTEYKEETQNNEREDMLYERLKSELHKGVHLNSQLLLEVDLLTKNVDSYHAMIAKQSRKLNASKIHYDTFVQKEKEQNKVVDEERKDMEQEDDVVTIQKEDNEVKEDVDFVVDKDDIKSPGSVRESTENESKAPKITVGLLADVEETESDPMKKYADQLVTRNKKYKEVLAILRSKVDELRSYRKKL